MSVNPASRRSSTIHCQSSSPKWRSSPTSKKRAPTTVSLVFAQPEQGSPLGSAIEKLPISMADDSTSLYSYSSGVGKRESMENISPADPSECMLVATPVETAQDQVAAELRHEQQGENIENLSQNGAPSPDESLPDVPSPLVTTPESVSVASEPPKEPSTPSPSRKFWFGSLSQARGRDKTPKSRSSTLFKAEVQPTDPQHAGPTPVQDSPNCEHSPSQLNQGPTIQEPLVSLPLNPTINNHSPPQPTTLHQPQQNRPQLSPSSYSPPPQKETALKKDLTARPSYPHLTSNVTSISSVDDEIPRPRSTPPGLFNDKSEQLSFARKQQEALPRFTLRMPLLGRPKMPLDQVVAVAQAEDTRKASSDDGAYDQETPIPAETDSLSEQLDQAQTVTVTTVGDVIDPAAQTRETSVAMDEVKPDASGKGFSWWNYVGWGSGTSLQTASPEVDPPETTDAAVEPQPSSAAVAEVHSIPAFPVTDLTSPTNASVMDPPQSEGNNNNSQEPDPTPSLLLADTARNLNPVWYAPWTWHNAPSDAPPNETTATDTLQPKTESELIKEEVLACENSEPTSSQPLPSELEAPPLASLEAVNPIRSSLSTNRSGWMSFFMAHSVKSITETGEKKEESGMEVMEIDEDEERNVVSASASTKPGKPYEQQPVLKSLATVPNVGKELKRSESPVTPLTIPESVKREVVKGGTSRQVSPSPSTRKPGPSRSAPPNLVLPTWGDTFHSPPRSVIAPPEASSSTITRTIRFVSTFLSSRDGRSSPSVKGKEKARDFVHFGKELPRALDIASETIDPVLLNGECKVVVIGIAGWSPGAVIRAVAGGLPSSSNKFVTMTTQALERFEETHSVKFKKITKIALEGDGTVARKVEKVHQHLLANQEWIEDLHAADVIFVAAHSQGSIVATHLIDRLIQGGHIRTSSTAERLAETPASIVSGGLVGNTVSGPQKICCLCLCGIHLGPLRYLKMSSFIQPYIQYFENAAAREIFEFQNTDNPVSRDYANALKNVMHHGTKMVYVASLNDQMVPIYSGLFTAASHPHILRALYIDGDAYHSSDFLSNLLVLLLRILNSGLSDSGLLTHLSEATAGSLSGVGHSSAYEEPAVFSLAVDYQFLTNNGNGEKRELVVEPFNAVTEQNDYEIPWSLRDLIANDRVAHFFSGEFISLRDAFGDWQPKTTILRDVKRKLQPIQRLSTISMTATSSSSPVSKL